MADVSKLHNMPEGSGLRAFMDQAAKEFLGKDELPKEWSEIVFWVASAWGTRVRAVAIEKGDLRERLHRAIDDELNK